MSRKLQTKYSRGFSVDTIEQARKFFLTYQTELVEEISEPVARKLESHSFKLSWSRYVKLIRIQNPSVIDKLRDRGMKNIEIFIGSRIRFHHKSLE